MPLIISNEDVIRILTMEDCLAAVERAFLELGKGDAAVADRATALPCCLATPP